MSNNNQHEDKKVLAEPLKENQKKNPWPYKEKKQPKLPVRLR